MTGMAIRTGAELHAARKAAAERYARVAYKHTPVRQLGSNWS
jgi:hypothetical protein